MLSVGVDPGYASGGAAMLRERRFLGVRGMPATEGEIPARVDAAAAWFCDYITAAYDLRISPDEPMILIVENQHGSAFGASERGTSNANSVWVREVVGGIRRHCVTMGIPVRLVNPQQWRTAFGLKSGATKKQAWDALCRLHPELATVKANEHGKDSAVIAHVGLMGAHLWAAEQRRAKQLRSMIHV